MTAPALVGAVSVARGGQLGFVLPGVSRVPYATGQQESCTRCAAAGVDRLGVSRSGPGSPALCLPCWRGERARRSRAERRELAAALWEGIGEAEAAAACQACGSPEPTPECWLCGWSWLAQARAEYEREQAVREAAEWAAFDAIARCTEAEDRLAGLEAWVERLRACLADFARSRPGSRGRPVALLADLLAREAAERAGRTSSAGRPSMLAYVGAVLAVDADWRSGRRGMPGRDRTAELAGCSRRAVSAAWRHGAELGAWRRTRQGGRLGLAERVTCARWNDRAEFDWAPLHRGDPVARAAHLPRALVVLGELLDHAEGLVEAARAELDEARARTDTWTDWPEQVRRARMRQAVARVRDVVTGLEPLDTAVNIRTPHMVCRGECVSSCLIWGFSYSPIIMIHSNRCGGAPQCGGKNQVGASRSPTERVLGDLDGSVPPPSHPRTPYGAHGSSLAGLPADLSRKPTWKRREVRRSPDWTWWAYRLAADLMALWPWLAGVPHRWVAATVGARLGPDWTARRLVDWVRRTRAGRPLLAAGEVARPAAYLRQVLDQALTGPDAPPWPARRHEQHRRDQASRQATVQAQATAVTRTAAEQRDAAAMPATASRAADMMAALRGTLPGRLRRADRVTLLGPGPQDTSGEPARQWPAPARPGAGLPAGVAPGDDRDPDKPR